MTLRDWAAIGFGALSGVAILFHLLVIMGAPWGRLTMGGRFDGQLPPAMRLASAVSAGLVAVMALAILSAAGLGPDWPRWTGWAALALSLASCLMNWLTPSRAERLLWGPLTTIMLLLAATVVLSRP